MSRVIRQQRRGHTDPQRSVDAWTREADAVTLPRVSEVEAQGRPGTVGTVYSEYEYGALADEQELVWPAEGESAARPYQVEAEGLTSADTATAFVLAASEKEVQEAQADYQDAVRVLTPYIRREPGSKMRYWVCWPLLILGDMAGVWSAAVINGDIPFIAFWQALASGVAAGCAGLVGSELKDLRMAQARQRDPESLGKDEQRYWRLFTGAGKGMALVRLVGLLSLLVVALLALGIATLRSGIEGIEAGVTFGLLAAATALGSGLLGYAAADEVADLVGTMENRLRRAIKRHLKLASSPAPRQRARALEEARSIKSEYQLRGQGAAKRVESLSWRVQRNNTHVLGHGFPAGEPSGVIGRKARRGDRS
ncbi:hypothetical protein AB0I91_13865 [Actinosynnema sp. NPDC049800]